MVQDQATCQQNLIRLLKALKTHLKQKSVTVTTITTTSSSSVSSSTAAAKTTISSATNPALANLLAAVDNSGNKLSMFHNLLWFEIKL